MIEEYKEPEFEESDCKTIQNWYEHASNELSNFCNLQFPKFPTKLPESELIFNEELQIEHALGQAYYPCVGGDKKTIIDIFSAAYFWSNRCHSDYCSNGSVQQRTVRCNRLLGNPM